MSLPGPVCVCPPPRLQPRPPASPCAGLGAGSWERAIFSPSAPDDAGGFFGSGSLLRQREQNQSGCLVGLETNKHAGSRRGQAGAGSARARTGLPAPQNPGILPGLVRAGGVGTAAGCPPLLPRPRRRQLPGNAVRAGLAPWFRAPPASPQHLERPLMSMKCPSEQIAIELNLHQPPALKAAILSSRAPERWN